MAQQYRSLFFGQEHAAKYHSKNPISRWLVNGFCVDLMALLQTTGLSDVHEVGCGEGHLSSIMLQAGFQVRGSDIDDAAVERARAEADQLGLGLPLKATSLFDLDEADRADVVVCTEVLEHLDEPALAMTKLVRLARRYLIVSAPREPLWRGMNMARGCYWSDLGNTPGHIQHWSSDGFCRFVSEFATIAVVRKPVPWTMVLCRINSTD